MYVHSGTVWALVCPIENIRSSIQQQLSIRVVARDVLLLLQYYYCYGHRGLCCAFLCVCLSPVTVASSSSSQR